MKSEIGRLLDSMSDNYQACRGCNQKTLVGDMDELPFIEGGWYHGKTLGLFCQECIRGVTKMREDARACTETKACEANALVQNGLVIVTCHLCKKTTLEELTFTSVGGMSAALIPTREFYRMFKEPTVFCSSCRELLEDRTSYRNYPLPPYAELHKKAAELVEDDEFCKDNQLIGSPCIIPFKVI